MKIPEIALLTRKSQGYITNGLILYLDGINNTRNGHDATSAKWEDLSGNGNDLTIVDSTKVALLDSAYSFNNGGSSSVTSIMRLDAFGSMKGTYEIVFSAYGGMQGKYVFTHTPSRDGDKCRVVALGGTTNLSANGNVAGERITSYDQFINQRSTLSLTEGDGKPLIYHVNGEAVQSSGSSSSRADAKNTELILGARYYGYAYNDPFYGEIACVRVYDRVLTADEILHNYLIDQQRFGSGVT